MSRIFWATAWFARAALRERLLARFVIVLDLTQALAHGVLGERLQHDARARHIIEQGVKPVVEQRQPVLHSGVAPAFAHCFVEQVVGRRRAERLDIAETEALDRIGGELKFGDRHEIEPAQLIGGALALRIEAADRFQRVPEIIEPHRLGRARCVKVDDPAAHRIVARLAHCRCTHETVELEPLDDAIHGEYVAGRDGKRFLRDKIPRRDPLERGIDGGEENRRRLILLRAGNPTEHGHALGDERGMRRNPVIGQAIPGGKLQRHDVRCEEAQCAGERAHALPVPAYDEKAYCSGIGAHRRGAGKVGNDQPLGAVGNSGERQRAAGCQQFGGRSGHAQLVRPRS